MHAKRVVLCGAGPGRPSTPSAVVLTELCSQGKAAWQERERALERDRERRPSACEAGINHRVKSTEARRRWMRRNRVSEAGWG